MTMLPQERLASVSYIQSPKLAYHSKQHPSWLPRPAGSGRSRQGVASLPARKGYGNNDGSSNAQDADCFIRAFSPDGYHGYVYTLKVDGASTAQASKVSIWPPVARSPDLQLHQPYEIAACWSSGQPLFSL